MTFKEARKQAREIAIKNGKWGYIFYDKSNQYYVLEDFDYSANLNKSFYVDKSGNILNIAKYEKISKKLTKSGITHFPFAPIVMKYIKDE